MRRFVVAGLVGALIGAAAVLGAPPDPARADGGPPVTVTPVATGLAVPWDVTFGADGTMLFTERGGRLSIRLPDGTIRQLAAGFGDLFVGSETGLLGIQVDPGFSANRVFYTCQGFQNASGRAVDIRVIKWSLNAGFTSASRVLNVVTGIPVTSGRHGGCRLRFDPAGHLYVGTGDSATNGVPQNRSSLGGKVLRVLTTGTNRPAPGNPFAGSADPDERLIYTYGHRNVQGLALRPGTNTMFSVEHGPGCDDEVNRLAPGADYGWRPVPVGGAYTEDEPMTAPGAAPAVYRSGCPTEALSGATFLRGSQWGAWDGALVVAALKNSYLRVMLLNADGSVRVTGLMPELTSRYGRLRTAQLAPDGSLYVTTSNGSNDQILRVTPAGGASLPAVARGATFLLRGSLTTGVAERALVFGDPGDRQLMCDWDGDGRASPAVFRAGLWYLTNSTTVGRTDVVFAFGDPGDTPVCGDWDGDGRDGPGVVRGRTWFVRDATSTGPSDLVFSYGDIGDRPIVGDWNGDGRDTPGLQRGRDYFLRNRSTTGTATIVFSFGDPGDLPVVGDWDNNGTETVGVVRGGTWFLRNAFAGGAADVVFGYGQPGDRFFVW